MIKFFKKLFGKPKQKNIPTYLKCCYCGNQFDDCTLLTESDFTDTDSDPTFSDDTYFGCVGTCTCCVKSQTYHAYGCDLDNCTFVAATIQINGLKFSWNVGKEVRCVQNSKAHKYPYRGDDIKEAVEIAKMHFRLMNLKAFV